MGGWANRRMEGGWVCELMDYFPGFQIQAPPHSARTSSIRVNSLRRAELCVCYIFSSRDKNYDLSLEIHCSEPIRS